MKRAQVRQRIEQYYYQLTEGCGDANCANANCCSNVQVGKRSRGKVGDLRLRSLCCFLM